MESGGFVAEKKKSDELYLLTKKSVDFSEKAVLWAKIAGIAAVISVILMLKDCSVFKPNNNANNSTNNNQASPTLN